VKLAGVCGLIDVESERPNAFEDVNRSFLEHCVAVIAALWEA
jgi:putative methionine-R-sulfoxide reductase with GAF domain